MLAWRVRGISTEALHQELTVLTINGNNKLSYRIGCCAHIHVQKGESRAELLRSRFPMHLVDKSGMRIARFTESVVLMIC